jgi:uncharacterized protein YeeX (DUF496 family)
MIILKNNLKNYIKKNLAKSEILELVIQSLNSYYKEEKYKFLTHT